MKRAVEFLLDAQNPDGGWGYKPGGMSFVEPTAAASLALFQDVENAPAVQRALTLLEQWQHSDGGWGIAPIDTESGWMTAWAVWALARRNVSATQRGVEWLLNTAGIRVTDKQQLQSVQKILKIDGAITGWPWQPGDAAWIFPTALTLVALDAIQVREHARVREGIQYLLDRAIPAGGWNIGNPFMVTGNLPPTVEATALALWALRVFGIENEITARAQSWLAQDNFTPTAFEWIWRALYWSKSGVSSERVRTALAAFQREDGSYDGNPFTTALSVMALG